jgi:hypothetical protein
MDFDCIALKDLSNVVSYARFFDVPLHKLLIRQGNKSLTNPAVMLHIL